MFVCLGRPYVIQREPPGLASLSTRPPLTSQALSLSTPTSDRSPRLFLLLGERQYQLVRLLDDLGHLDHATQPEELQPTVQAFVP